MRHQSTDAAAGDDADRVETGSDEEVLQLGGLADERLQVGREAFRSAEELAYARIHRDRHTLHRALDVGAHAIPVGLDLAEREISGYAFDTPWRADRLEQADHEAAHFLAEITKRRRILEHGPVGRDVLDALGDQIVVLGGLQWDVDADLGGEL